MWVSLFLVCTKSCCPGASSLSPPGLFLLSERVLALLPQLGPHSLAPNEVLSVAPRQLAFCSRAAPGKKRWGVPDWGKPMFDSPLLAYAVLIVSLASLVYSLKDE